MTVSTDPRWKAVADAVRERRKVLGLTQIEAAGLAGIGIATWKRIERGQIADFDVAVRIATTLGWPGSWLFQIACGEVVYETGRI